LFKAKKRRKKGQIRIEKKKKKKKKKKKTTNPPRRQSTIALKVPYLSKISEKNQKKKHHKVSKNAPKTPFLALFRHFFAPKTRAGGAFICETAGKNGPWRAIFPAISLIKL
jgi:ATP adenylyltransferase/5',5'''-P-1,P-4-tetraphosphate phosphorylase II